MKKLLLIPALLIAAFAFADRAVIWDSSRVTTDQGRLYLLPDGGCRAEACAAVLQRDGGTGYSSCNGQELAGTARTRCLNVLSDMDVLWKNAEGL